MSDRGCDTCKHLDEMNGICKKNLAVEFEVRSCDTSKCDEYVVDPFYASLERSDGE
jgi:hypothetical protein